MIEELESLHPTDTWTAPYLGNKPTYPTKGYDITSVIAFNTFLNTLY
jgi:hypothetical protein